jgi:hypothetical protein
MKESTSDHEESVEVRLHQVQETAPVAEGRVMILCEFEHPSDELQRLEFAVGEMKVVPRGR